MPIWKGGRSWREPAAAVAYTAGGGGGGGGGGAAGRTPPISPGLAGGGGWRCRIRCICAGTPIFGPSTGKATLAVLLGGGSARARAIEEGGVTLIGNRFCWELAITALRGRHQSIFTLNEELGLDRHFLASINILDAQGRPREGGAAVEFRVVVETTGGPCPGCGASAGAPAGLGFRGGPPVGASAAAECLPARPEEQQMFDRSTAPSEIDSVQAEHPVDSPTKQSLLPIAFAPLKVDQLSSH